MQHPERLGKFELIRHLASGGMARVYLARVSGMAGFERYCVLKTVRPERIEDQSYVHMFLDEARLVAALHHQHIAQVFEVGAADDGTYFMAMEYLHGETVRTVLETARSHAYTLPLDFGLTVVCNAAAGLHHAHERRGPDGQRLGIVHRDVSPSNVIIGYDGSVKMIDFGIAKAEARTTKTQTGFVKGKAGYMAPEQALGYPVDRRSDVFALGIVLYELTTQTRAFRAASEYEAVQRIVKGDLVRPRQVAPNFPGELEDVVMNALETDPDDRFQDADAMRRAIELTAHHLGLSIGASTVGRVLHDVCGTRPEPWLVTEPDDDDDDDNSETVVVSGSMPAHAAPRPPAHAAMPVPPPAAPRLPVPAPTPALRAGSAIVIEGDEIPTHRFITVDSEPGAPVARVALGTRPPPSNLAAPAAIAAVTRPRAPTVPMRVTPPSRAAAVLGPMAPTAPLPAAPSANASLLPAISEPFAAGTGNGPSFEVHPKRRAPMWIALGLVAFAVGAVVLVATGTIGRGSSESAAAATTSSSAPAATASGFGSAASNGKPAPAPAPAKASSAARAQTAGMVSNATAVPLPTPAGGAIAVRVTTEPSDATVVLDGVRLGHAPFEGTFPASARDGWLKIRKQGYVTVRMQVRLDQTVDQTITLSRR